MTKENEALLNLNDQKYVAYPNVKARHKHLK
uniref:Uncharacterized protein n=1 Tax=Rhizophora mucronata TaxID=61149 RepID=A0A2P2R2I9_RHIMU